MPLIETGASASLDMGAVSDGQYLKRSGTNIIGATVGGGTGLPNANCHVTEIFDGLATGNIDGLGSYYQCDPWAVTAAATTTAEVAVKSGADKMLRCYSPVGAGTVSAALAITSTIGLSGGCRIRWKMRSDQDAAGFSGGLLIANAAGTTVASIRYGYSSGWKLRWFDGTTTTNLAVAVKDTWYQYDMVIITGPANYARIWVDGVYTTQQTTGSSTTSWNGVKAYCTNTAAAGGLNLDIDDLSVYSLFPLFTE